MFGRCAVDTFLIPQFEQVVQRIIQNDWAKRTINLRIGAVKQMFQHAMMRDLITGEQYAKIEKLSENRSCVPSFLTPRSLTFTNPSLILGTVHDSRNHASPVSRIFTPSRSCCKFDNAYALWEAIACQPSMAAFSSGIGISCGTGILLEYKL